MASQDNTQLTAFRQQPSNPNAPPPPTSLVRNSSTGNTRLFDFNVAQQQLRPYIKNSLQDAVLRLPGRIVTFLRGRVRPDQIIGMRDSYVNAFLIQSRGTAAEPPCVACQEKMILDADGYANPFPTCVRLPGHFGGSCGNCKWRDHAARCTRRDDIDDPVRQGHSGQGNPPPQRRRGRGRGRGQGQRQRQIASGSAGNPINLDDDDDDEYEIEIEGYGEFTYDGESEEEEEEEGTTGNPIRLLEN